jgi:hypothetical protein
MVPLLTLSPLPFLTLQDLVGTGQSGVKSFATKKVLTHFNNCQQDVPRITKKFMWVLKSVP